MEASRSDRSNDIIVETVRNGAAAALLDDLARLRISVFREWPYLYEGDVGYERAYLAAFAQAPDCALVVARDGDQLVGAATAMPMSRADGVFRQPFEAGGDALDKVYYFGESVLQPEYRGRGAGHRFFDLREEHARSAGADMVTFCAVVRPQSDPRRVAGVRSLEPFWDKRGYAPLPGYFTRVSWPEVGAGGDVENLMRFWGRAL